MEEASVIGTDPAKRSFRVHGAKADGSVAFRRKPSRGKVLSFLASQPPCTVAMEACAGHPSNPHFATKCWSSLRLRGSKGDGAIPRQSTVSYRRYDRATSSVKHRCVTCYTFHGNNSSVNGPAKTSPAAWRS